MINVEAAFIDKYVEAVGASVNAFMPLIAAVIGLVLAFAIANMLRFFIQRTIMRMR